MNRFVVYTAIFNNYDELKDPVIASNNVDFICYTDALSLRSKVWSVRYVKCDDGNYSLMNRKIKLLFPYTELSCYDYSLYVDGSIMIKDDVFVFFNKYLDIHPIMNFRHPNNDCIFREILRCVQQARGKSEELLDQYVYYKNQDMPSHFGLSDNKIILRNNKSEIGYNIMKQWFDQVITFSGRDQVCFSYVLYMNNEKYYFFQENIESNLFFETWPHREAPFKIIVWRKVKWFFEKRGMFVRFFNYINVRIKPVYLKKCNK